MWRSNTKTVFTRIKGNSAPRVPRRGQITTESGMPPPAQPPTPPPPSKKGFPIFKVSALALVGSWGAVTYLSYADPSFRSKVELNIPYAKEEFQVLFPVIDSLVQGKMPWSSDETTKTPDTTPPSLVPKKVTETATKVLETVKPEEKAAPAPKVESPPPPPPTPSPPPEPPKPVLSEKEQKKAEEKRRKEEEKRWKQEEAERKKEAAKREAKLREEKEAKMNEALKTLLDKLSNEVTTKANETMELQRVFISKIREHTQTLKKAMEDTEDILEKELQWDSVRDAFDKREEAKQAAEKAAQQTLEHLDKLKKAIAEGRAQAVTKKNKAIAAAQESFNNLSKEINKIASEVAKAESESNMMTKYKDLVRQAKKDFQKELESIMPSVSVGGARGKRMTEEELNALIAHAHRRIEQLQKQLAEQLAMEEKRTAAALEQQKEEDAKLAEQQVQHALDRAKNEFLLEKDRWESEAQVLLERELGVQMSRQAGAHSLHLQEVLQEQEKFLGKKYARELDLRLMEERQAFEQEVHAWVARLKGIETAVSRRAEAEKTAKDAQALWLACVSLTGAIEQGRQGHEWEDQLQPLEASLQAIEESSGHNPFVAVLANSFPKEALNKGVWTEKNLKLRFDKVGRVCCRVARIDGAGGSLYEYALSYLQAMFMFPKVTLTSRSQEVDPEELDTYQIVAHARYFLQRGDLEQAVRLIGQLKGMPASVASDWLRDARLLLEARQAALSLAAFASAQGLASIF